jgi:hypothetical protein
MCLASLALAGCVTYLGHAKRAYAQGMYLEVAEDLGRHEEDVPYMSPREQVDYGLYRGLALAELGDPASSRRWLEYARTVGWDNPGALSQTQQAVLERSLTDVLRRLAAGPPPRAGRSLGDLCAADPASCPTVDGPPRALSPSR